MLTMLGAYYGIGVVIYGAAYASSPIVRAFFDDSVPRLGSFWRQLVAVMIVPATWPMAVVHAWRNR